MTRPPNSSLTGSQVVRVRKPRPYLSMAGQALIASDTRMAISMPRVNSAAALASQPKMRSAMGPERAIFGAAGRLMTRPEEGADGLKGISVTGSVEDLRNFLKNSRADDYRIT